MKKQITRFVIGLAALSAVAAFAIPASLDNAKPVLSEKLTLQGSAKKVDNVVVMKGKKQLEAQKAQLNALEQNTLTATEKVSHRAPKVRAASGAAVTLPYEETFDNEATFADWTVINANEDSKAWHWYESTIGGSARIAWGYDMDDWLISPALPLEAGKTYDLSLITWEQSTYYTERLEIFMGTAPTAEAMTIEVVPAFDVVTPITAPMEVTGTLAPTTTGDYYVGIHCISPDNQYYVYVKNFYVSAPISGATPAQVSDVAFTPATNGDPSVTINFTAPSTTIGGDPTTLTKVEILCDDEVVKTFDAPEAGAQLSYVDTRDADGEYTYSIIAYNEEGASKAYTKTVYVGVNLAAAPEDVIVTEWASTPGKVTISWTPVAKDVEGNEIDGSLITYDVYDRDSELVAEGITFDAHEYTYQAVEEGEQEFVYFFVFPVTNKGANMTSGGYGVTDMIPCGTAYTMPMVESFEGKSLQYNFVQSYTGYYGFGLLSSCSNPEATPVDNDGGMIDWWPVGGDNGLFLSGKVHVDESEFASFSFYYHTTPAESYDIMPVIVVAGIQYDLLDEPISTLCTDTTVDETEATVYNLSWQRVIVPLVDYLGSDVQIGVKTHCYNDQSYLLLDQLAVENVCPNDLAVTSIAAPRGVEVNQEATVTVTVKNVGLEASTAATVDLLLNGEVAQTKDVPALEPQEATNIEFTIKFDVFAEPYYAIQAQVAYDSDQEAGNNLSNNVYIVVSQTMMNPVNDFAGELTDEGVKLTWTAPDPVVLPSVVTEDFENAESWADVVDGWTIIDGDGAPMGGFDGITLPGHTSGSSPLAYFVFDSEGDDFNASFLAYSGSKYMCAFYNADGSNNDDWLITPELSGTAQTISFAAKSYSSRYGYESMEMLYSTTDTDPDNFTSIETVQRVPTDWTVYEVEVPEGAKYFAIRCISQNVLAFFVDDVTFEGVPQTPPTVVSYNVYRNAELIAEGVTALTYTDDEALEPNTTYKYDVTAVYDNGQESPLPVDIVEITTPLLKVEDLNGLTDMPDGYHFEMACQLTVIYCAEGLAVVTDGASNAMLTVTEDYEAGDVLAANWEAIYFEGLPNLAAADEDPEVASKVEAPQPALCAVDDIATQQAKNLNYVVIEKVTINEDAIDEATETEGMSMVVYADETPVLLVNYFGIELPNVAASYAVTGFFAINPSPVAQLEGETPLQYIFIPTEFVEVFEYVEALNVLSDFPEMTHFIMGCPLTVIYSDEDLAVVTDGETNVVFINDAQYVAGGVLETGWKAIYYGEGLAGVGCLDEELPAITSTVDAPAPVDCPSEDITVMQAKNLNYVTLLGVTIDEDALDELEESEGVSCLAYADEVPVLIVNYFNATMPEKTGVYKIEGFFALNTTPIAQMSESTPLQYIFVPVEFTLTDGIAGIEAVNPDATYYDLKGLQIANPKAGNVYIRVADGKAAKVLVK